MKTKKIEVEGRLKSQQELENHPNNPVKHTINHPSSSGLMSAHSGPGFLKSLDSLVKNLEGRT